MSNLLDNLGFSSVKTEEQGYELLHKLVAVAQPGAVFAQPVTAGEYTLINAAEVSAGLGFGGGSGGCSCGCDCDCTPPAKKDDDTDPSQTAQMPGGSGRGMGGGGGSMARPIATIVIGPDGVKVEPIVDVTKIVLAFLTAFGTMAVMLNRINRGR